MNERLELLPTLSAAEHHYLSRISDAASIEDADSIRSEMMQKPCTTISPFVEFIRTALHHFGRAPDPFGLTNMGWIAPHCTLQA